jgi:hypothetical protein
MYFLEMRKKSLNDNEVSLLKVRISLSRIIRIFKIDELANEWKINRVTLFRYDSPKYRKSQATLSKETKLVRRFRKEKCSFCLKPIKGHRRCLCTRLLHGTDNCCLIVTNKKVNL